MRKKKDALWNRGQGRHLLMLFLLAGGTVLGSPAQGAQDPDELYRKGRYAEAQEIYARSDMDHPRDLRYRYNRGCAQYQAGDYQGAMAAFSSVLRRAEDREIRFKSAYNLGNATFKMDDPGLAIEFYRQALRIDPGQENARHNLEIALRAREAQKKEKEKKEEGARRQRARKDGADTSGQEKGGETKSPDSGPQKDGDRKGAGDPQETQRGSQTAGDQDGKKETGKGHSGDSEEHVPEDLSGELQARETLPEPTEPMKEGAAAVSSMDRKKAEALLDNVAEDRSKFLRRQMSQKACRQAASGKDW